MPGLMSHMLRPAPGTGAVAAGAGPRREMTRREDIVPRQGRPLVTGTAPDHPARSAPGTVPVYVSPVQPATPFALYTIPRRRLGPVPKLAPGHQGSGLGQTVASGFQTLNYPGFNPLENAPRTNANFHIPIPRGIGLMTEGRELGPTYRAHPFAPATRQFNQARSSGMWAQASFPPQFRPLTPSQQAIMLRRPATFARRQVPAAQPNPGLYTIGYPTRIGVAARLGGGPIAVLGGNSQ